jgi:hypothetical protein
MRNIGILTYIKEYANIGTNMQAYCTLMAVQRQFPDDHVEIIDYSGWKPEKRPTLYNISIKSLINDFTRIRKYDDFFKNEYRFSKRNLISSDLKESLDFIKGQNYDAIFVGSDTLLELKRAKNDELTAYWLDETVRAKKFLIAASSHNVIFEDLTENQKNKIQKTIDDFSLLGVRDEATFRLLSHFTQKDYSRLQIIPDPTFTYNIDYKHIEDYLGRNKINFRKPVVCLHLLRSIKWASELADYFRKEGFLVASLRPAYYADIVFNDLSAFEQLGLYKYFNLVITHRFHDSIFSLKNLTPVIVFPENFSDITVHGENKNRTLFKSFNIEDNYISSRDNLNALSVFRMYSGAIENFRRNEFYISETLIENKRKYETFLNKSAALLDGDKKISPNVKAEISVK